MRIHLLTFTTVLLAALVGVTYAAPDIGPLLNKASSMNYEEVQTAKTVKDRAGDNQALTTFAETLKGDHEANEEAVKVLAKQKGVTLNRDTSTADQKVKALEKLDGGAFNDALLKDSVEGHEEALDSFKQAKEQFKGDRDVELYIEQTIPVLKAHLEMAKNLKANLGTSEAENPANNKRQ